MELWLIFIKKNMLHTEPPSLVEVNKSRGFFFPFSLFREQENHNVYQFMFLQCNWKD